MTFPNINRFLYFFAPNYLVMNRTLQDTKIPVSLHRVYKLTRPCKTENNAFSHEQWNVRIKPLNVDIKFSREVYRPRFYSKMSAFGVDTGSQTTLPLINGVIHSALFQYTPHAWETLSQLVDVMQDILNFRSGVYEYPFNASKFWYSNRQHQWLAKGCARAQQSSRWDSLIS